MNYKNAAKRISLLLFPALLWWAATTSRHWFIHPHCAQNPQSCTRDSVFFLDRFSLGVEDGKADEYSYVAQNISGILGLAVPTLWHGTQLLLGVSWPAVLVNLTSDLGLVIQTAAWNGFFTEASHLFVQRPRPFVYTDPVGRGLDPAHYTSFYSGHTSFVSAMNAAIFLILLYRGAPLLILLFSAGLWEVMVFFTAYFRMMAGRHFLTDVTTGAVAGAFMAWLIVYYGGSRKKQKAGSHK